MLKKTLLAANAIAVIALLGVLSLNWWTGRPVDYARPHGDQCLTNPQGDYERCWDILVPDSANTEPLALIVDLHALGGNPASHRKVSGIQQLADQHGFIAVWPAGIDESWNAGGNSWPDPAVIDQSPGSGCCGSSLNAKLDDVGFLVSMVDQISQDTNIDPGRVFLFGHSNGCFMAQRVLAESVGVFTGLACTSGYLLVEPVASYEPVPVLLMHGVLDGVVEYRANYWDGAIANSSKWGALNGCSDEPIKRFDGLDDPSTAEVSRWVDCDVGASVQLISVQAGHNLYFDGNGDGPAAVAWAFLNG